MNLYKVEYNHSATQHVLAEDIEQALKAFIDLLRDLIDVSGLVPHPWNGIHIKSITKVEQTAAEIIIVPPLTDDK